MEKRMRKRWFKILMGLFVLLFAGLWIVGGVAEARSKRIKLREHHKHHSPVVSYKVGGTISELADGEKVVLLNNGREDLEITANGVFTFSTPNPNLTTYDVTILIQPENQSCRVNNGSGTINGVNVTDITIICSAFHNYIAGGGVHTIELRSDGTVWTWGDNNTGQLGDGTTIDSPAPIQVSELADVTAIAAGGYNSYRTENSHTAALKADGTVWTWGDNSTGQLGDGTKTDRTRPIQVIGLTNVVSVAAGGAHTIALKTDRTVWTWGYNIAGQLGVETTEECEFDSIISYCSTTPVQVSGLTDVIAIAGGAFHTVALKSNGTVWIWGDNSVSQLGDGTTTNSVTPIQVNDLTDITAIAAGGRHTLALKTNGTVWAWGSNSIGQLGDGTSWAFGTTEDSTTPIQVIGLTGVIAIAAGGRDWYTEHSIALKNDGTVWGWGSNEQGQLGVETTEICSISFGKEAVSHMLCSTMPVQVSNLTDVTAIAAGWVHTVALKTDGVVWAWGDNTRGQLGVTTTEICYEVYVGPFDCSTKPVEVRSKVTGTFNVSGMISGLTTGTLILQNNGGDDLVITENGPFTFATALEDLAVYDIEFLTQPDGQSCKTMDINSGRINGADATDVSVICSKSFTDAAAIAGGGYHSIALKSDGMIWAWGSNSVGQLGVETTELCFYSFTCSTTPVQISGLTDVTAIGNSGDTMVNGQTIALKDNGTVWAWGSNGYGQLGDGTRTDSFTPVQVCASGETDPCANFLTDIAVIVSGGNHTIMLKNNGMIWAWGSNQYGQLGATTTETCRYNYPCSTTPLQVSGLTDVTSISAGRDHTIAIKNDGTLWAWGLNSSGQLGNGTRTNSTTPLQVSGLTDVISISAGRNHTLALKANGTVWAWGSNGYGQLGDGTKNDRSTPVQVSGFTDVTEIVGGGNHTLALKADGTLWTWGWNLYGQLGDGTRNDRSTPVQVSGLTDVVEIEGGGSHTLALKADGTVWAWGDNRFGQLGNATTIDSTVPVQVLVMP